MRRISALLLAAGLAAPVSAAAGPSSKDPWSTSPQIVEKFEWSTSRGRLGVTVIGLTPELRKHFGAPEDQGVLVARVEPGTPASTAGINVGDVIVAVHGRKIDSAGDVISALASIAKGERAKIALVRANKSRQVEATLMDEAPSGTFPSGMFPWLREWMKPDSDHSFPSPFDESWFRDWMKSFERKPDAKSADADVTTWLRKLRDLFQPKTPESAPNKES